MLAFAVRGRRLPGLSRRYSLPTAGGVGRTLGHEACTAPCHADRASTGVAVKRGHALAVLGCRLRYMHSVLCAFRCVAPGASRLPMCCLRAACVVPACCVCRQHSASSVCLGLPPRHASVLRSYITQYDKDNFRSPPGVALRDAPNECHSGTENVGNQNLVSLFGSGRTPALLVLRLQTTHRAERSPA